TYGFPLDLTQDALRAQGRAVDTDAFQAAMARQREAARAAWKGSGEAAVEPVWFDIREQNGPTEFLGYATTRAEGRVVAIVRGDGTSVPEARPGEEVRILVNQTPFYGESGGQVGDTGTITAARGAVVNVTDTVKKLGDLHVHFGTLAGDQLRVGDTVELAVDEARRDRIRRAHSATHLLHAALRRHLGDHVAQKGSLVAPDRLRFDFSHQKPLTPDELRAVEAEVNHHLRRNALASVLVMDRDAAIEAGAMALFGEKYGDQVRVVSMGEPVAGDGGRPYSVELCGGTHVRRTGDVALFRIVAEGAVASGIRRIEALTGEAAFDEARREHDTLLGLAQSLKVAVPDLPGRLEGLVEERRRLEREVAELRRKLATGEASGSGDGGVRQVGEIRFAGRHLEGVPAKELRGTADAIKQQLGSGVVALVSVNDGKAAVVVSVTDDLAGKVDAVELVRRGVAAVGGSGGGGRREFAQGGGPDGANAPQALAAIEAGLAG
ncbi:MAG TPA: alanine--tRNA ligase-related protein, partial [Geminicoccaceae bacterium]